MTLFFCAWDRDDGPCSVVADAEDERSAREMARDVADGEEPRRVIPWGKNVFIAEVVERETDDSDDDADEVEILLSPFPHAAAALELLEDAADGTARAVAIDAPQCEAEATDHERTWRCVLLEGHDGDHRASDGETWEE